ncbi:MAG: hypothetical protein KatS3mg087_1717 [Patescibacteria group bacterium]|jgi:hypothetical protein|nr:MAG: hypothetical protein KatS3mg087_1717 [Patescibacteria group bacterium]
MQKRKSDRITPTIQIQSICIYGQNATKVGHIQKRKLTEDKLHNGILLESVQIPILNISNHLGSLLGFHPKDLRNLLGFCRNDLVDSINISY